MGKMCYLRFVIKLSSSLWIVFAAQSLSAQELNEESLQEQLRLNEQRLQLINSRTEIVDAETSLVQSQGQLIDAQLDAFLPQSGESIEALDGTKESDTQVEQQILTYESIEKIAESITIDIEEKVPSARNIIVLDEEVTNSLFLYELFIGQVSLFDNAYNQILEDRSPNANTDRLPNTTSSLGTAALGLRILDVPAPIVKAFANFTSLFNENVVTERTEITLQKDAIVAAIASEFKDSEVLDVSVYYPEQYLINTSIYNNIWGVIQNLTLDRANAEQKLSQLRALPESRNTNQRIQSIESINQQFDEFFAALVGSPSNSLSGTEENPINFQNPNPLYLVARAASIKTMIDSPLTYSLSIEIPFAEGSERTSTNIFLGSRIRHSGSTIANYVLYNNRGAIAASNNNIEFSGYRRIRRPYSSSDSD